MITEPITTQDLQTPCPMCGAPVSIGADTCENCGESLRARLSLEPQATIAEQIFGTILLLGTIVFSVPFTMTFLASGEVFAVLLCILVNCLLWGPTAYAFSSVRKTKFADRSTHRLLVQSLLVGWCLLLAVPILLFALCATVMIFSR